MRRGRLSAAPNSSEPRVAPNGQSLGAMDMACPGRAESSDKCACQIRCRKGGCANAMRLCRRIEECAVVSINAPTLHAASWATLKRSRPPDESWITSVHAHALLARSPPPITQPQLRPALGEVARHWAPGVGASTSLCGAHSESSLQNVLAAAQRVTIGILALTFRQPRSLESSLRSWSKGGLLDLASERLLVANDPMVEELALASMYGFVVRQPSEISGAKMRKPNVITIGQALFHGLRELRSDHVLFLEKDFALVESVPKPKLHAELLGASAMLLSHASVVYLRSRTEQGCDSFAPCGRPFVPRGGSWATRNNWWNFYCSSFHRPGRVADCLARSSDVTRAGTGDSSTPRSLSGDAESPGFRCHTSEDANWSLNAAMLNRTAVLERPLCVGGSSASGKCSTTIGHLAEESHDRQDGLETKMLDMDWGKWKVPLCISYDGLFVHREVDG